MSFWSRLFGRERDDEGGSPRPTKSGVRDDWSRADCGFCERPQIECDQSAPYPYPVWKCPCGAIGSGAWPPDLDEVGDQLLEILGINERVSEPCVPTDHPAISIQHYDAKRVEEDMAAILKKHGYEFRVTARMQSNCNDRLFWVRLGEPRV